MRPELAVRIELRCKNCTPATSSTAQGSLNPVFLNAPEGLVDQRAQAMWLVKQAVSSSAGRLLQRRCGPTASDRPWKAFLSRFRSDVGAALAPLRAARQPSGIADIKVKVYSLSSCQYGRAEVRVLEDFHFSGNQLAVGGQHSLTFNSWSIRQRLCAPRAAIHCHATKGESYVGMGDAS